MKTFSLTNLIGNYGHHFGWDKSYVWKSCPCYVYKIMINIPSSFKAATWCLELLKCSSFTKIASCRTFGLSEMNNICEWFESWIDLLVENLERSCTQIKVQKYKNVFLLHSTDFCTLRPLEITQGWHLLGLNSEKSCYKSGKVLRLTQLFVYSISRTRGRVVKYDDLSDIWGQDSSS